MNRKRFLTLARLALLGIGCSAAISSVQAATFTDLLDPSWWFGDSHERDWRYYRYRSSGPWGGPWYGGGWGAPWGYGAPGWYGYPPAPMVAASGSTTTKEELPE